MQLLFFFQVQNQNCAKIIDNFYYNFLFFRRSLFFYLCHPVHQAVVRVSALVHAVYPLESRILYDLQRYFVLLSELLHLSHYTVSYVRYALCVQTLHHVLYYVQFVLYREINEIRVDEYVIGRSELGVVLEEESRGLLRHFFDFELRRILGFLLSGRRTFLFFSIAQIQKLTPYSKNNKYKNLLIIDK